MERSRPARWWSYLTNFLSVNLLKLLGSDRAVLGLVADRAELSLRRTGFATRVDVRKLLRGARLSLFAPALTALTVLFILPTVVILAVELGALQYARQIESLNRPLMKPVGQYDPRIAANVIRVFAIMNDRLGEIAPTYFIPPGWHPNFGPEYVNNLHVKGKVVWAAAVPAPKAPGAGVTGAPLNDFLVLRPSPQSDIDLVYNGNVISRYDKFWNPSAAEGRVTACPNAATSEAMKEAEFAFVIVPSRLVEPDGKRALAAEWSIAVDRMRATPERFENVFLPALQEGERIESLAVSACHTGLGEFQAITMHIEYELSSPKSPRQLIARKFMAVIDPRAANFDVPEPTPAAGAGANAEKAVEEKKFADAKRAAEQLYQRLQEFCGAGAVKPDDAVPTVLEKFSSCVPVAGREPR
jgi:hypothetical protein